MAIRLLLVEDEIDLGHVLKLYLEMNGFEVVLARSGKEGLERFGRDPVDICVLDVMLPEMDGFAVAKAIKRHRPGMPFVFLTACASKEERLLGLGLGAADYICKPFEADELVLRIRNILVRAEPQTQPQMVVGQYRYDAENLTLRHVDGQERRLTRREADLLGMLLGRPGQVVRKKDILNRLWQDNDYFSARSLDVFVSRLRKYMQDDPAIQIETVRGEGYVLMIEMG